MRRFLFIIVLLLYNNLSYSYTDLYEPFYNGMPSDEQINVQTNRNIKRIKTGKFNPGRYDNTKDSRQGVGIHTKDVSTSNPYGSGFFGGLLWGITEATGCGGTVTIIVDGKKQTIYIYNNGSNDDLDKYNEDDGYKDWINGGNIGTYNDYSVATPLDEEYILFICIILYLIIKRKASLDAHS